MMAAYCEYNDILQKPSKEMNGWMYTHCLHILQDNIAKSTKVKKKFSSPLTFVFKQNILPPRHYQLRKGCHLPLKLLVCFPFSCATPSAVPSCIKYGSEQGCLRAHPILIRGIPILGYYSLLHRVAGPDVR